MTDLLINLEYVAFFIIAGVAISAIIAAPWRRSGTEETIKQRINRLTGSLSEAAHVIQEIETEIRERREIVDRLQSDIDTYNRLRALDQAEVEAVAQVLGVELRRESRRSFWTNFALNMGFFVLGAVVSVVLQTV